ncbi:MAG: glycosyltransferase [Candidatus Parvarchaeota archaeon]|jgi:glycosyltransferase involved in cell wall biosynthesis|nr:glycosyltransferase [Candidatus Parvarchaeota archaeon]MCL5106691.1 glycosyltransferase [Candidatus Parvarchaeota archaeon]
MDNINLENMLNKDNRSNTNSADSGMAVGKPNLSVILATRNRPEQLKTSIESVLSQTYKDFELLVVDGSDNEDSRKIIEQYSEKDPRIRYLRDAGTGPAAARNLALAQANGAYITFQDDDIVMKPQKLQILLAGFEGENADTGVVYCSHIEVRPSGRTRQVPTIFRKDEQGYAKNLHKRLTKGCVVDSSAGLIKRECFEKVGGFDDKLKTAEDWDMYLRIAQKYKFKFIDEPAYTSYLSKNSLRFDMDKFKAANKVIRKKTASYLKDVGLIPYLGYRLSSYYSAGLGYRLFVALTGPGYQAQPTQVNPSAKSVEDNIE